MSVESPAPTIEYSAVAQRGWPWDVRVILWIGILYSALTLVQSGLGIMYVVRNNNYVWFTNNYNGWSYLLGVVLRSVLPALMLIGLLGVRSFRPGSRRLTYLAAGVLLAFGLIESIVGIAAMFAGPTHGWDFPGSIVGTCQGFLQGNGGLIVLLVTLKRPDVRMAVE